MVAQIVKNLSAMPETWVPSLGWEDPLKAEMPHIFPQRLWGASRGAGVARRGRTFLGWRCRGGRRRRGPRGYARPLPEPRAGCAPGSWSPDRAPTSPASVPPSSEHSFVYIHTNSQADSFEHIARPPVLLAAASPHSSPPFSSIGFLQEQPD